MSETPNTVDNAIKDLDKVFRELRDAYLDMYASDCQPSQVEAFLDQCAEVLDVTDGDIEGHRWAVEQWAAEEHAKSVLASAQAEREHYDEENIPF